jgi:hypothetical protein
MIKWGDIVWHKVTWYSKAIAVVLFTVLIPAWAFYMGIKYQQISFEVNQYTRFENEFKRLVSGKSDPIKKFYSKDLGIQFKYDDQGGKITVKQEGSRVYINDAQTQESVGQFVEVFSKASDVSFADAIKEQILTDFPSETCNVVVDFSQPYTLDRRGYQVAEIVYPEPETPDHFWTEHAKDCNPEYAQTNGVRYFLYYPEHPTEFYFFNIGQSAIKAGDNRLWQQTFNIVK